MSPNKALLRLGFQNFTSKMSAVNAAVQYALFNSVKGDGPNYALDLPAVVLSKGELPESPTMKLDPVGVDNKLTFTWDPTKDLIPALQVAHGLDRATFLLYNSTKNKFIRYLTYADRKDGTVSLIVPFIFAGDTIHAYYFFSSPDGKQVSNSGYLGTGKTTA